jgi:hypothetical protein
LRDRRRVARFSLAPDPRPSSSMSPAKRLNRCLCLDQPRSGTAGSAKSSCVPLTPLNS